MSKSCVVLFSGGLDSTTTLYLAKKKGLRVYALTLDYGQLHRREIESARTIARRLGIPHHVLKISLPWKGSALLDKSKQLPKNRSVREMNAEIPVTYVPARNTIFLSFALSWAEVINASSVWIGANAVDYSGYPDCRPDYISAVEKVFRLGTKNGRQGKTISIEVPLIRKTKADIVKLALSLGVPLDETWSCYRGGKKPCGTCDSCLLREKGFEEAGVSYAKTRT
ncbi:MAG: 7-cyano-7-deazaguanine synthase QueC [Candidatus Omnitrophica bacterium]|nr:7-cyano-7-deazaguanine synthase QueC [Candidatus Omnitrophota bacterium]